MIPVGTLATFFGASFLLAMAPGPDNIFVLTQSALYGSRAGIIVTCGLCTGLLIHTTAVALGVTAVVQASQTAFLALKYIGACYLLYLAWQSLRASASTLEGDTRQVASMNELYRRGIIMNVTNPKVAVFFLAVLPQFADPARGSLIAQILQLGVTFVAATVLVFGSVSCLAGTIGHWLRRSPRTQRIMQCTTAVILAGLALKLVTAKN